MFTEEVPSSDNNVRVCLLFLCSDKDGIHYLKIFIQTKSLRKIPPPKKKKSLICLFRQVVAQELIKTTNKRMFGSVSATVWIRSWGIFGFLWPTLYQAKWLILSAAHRRWSSERFRFISSNTTPTRRPFLPQSPVKRISCSDATDWLRSVLLFTKICLHVCWKCLQNRKRMGRKDKKDNKKIHIWACIHTVLFGLNAYLEGKSSFPASGRSSLYPTV